MRENKNTDIIVDSDLCDTHSDGEKYRQSRAKRRKIPVFYIVYFVTVAVVLLLIGAGLIIEKSILEEYEAVQPKYMAQQVFDEYFGGSLDVERLMGVSEEMTAAFESKENVAQFISDKVREGEITYSETVSSEAGVHSYNVYSDGVRFATFSLVEGEEKTEHGFAYYKLRDIRLTFMLPDNSYDLLIPAGYKLFANGIAVSERYVAGSYVETPAYTLTAGREGVRYVPYTVTGFLSTPTFTVTDENGVSVELLYNSEEGYYTVATQTLTLTVPKGYVAYIGQSAIGEEYLVEGSEQASAYDAFLCEGAVGVQYVSYSVSGFFDIPKLADITVNDTAGNKCDVRYHDATLTYEALPSYSETLRAENEAWLIEVFEKYMLYMQNIEGTAKSDIKPYFDTSSQIWKHINSVNPNWQYEASSYEFSEESVSEFIGTGEGSFICRVRLTYTGVRKSSKYTETIDSVVFLKEKSGKYLIYDIVTTSAIDGVGEPLQ